MSQPCLSVEGSQRTLGAALLGALRGTARAAWRRCPGTVVLIVVADRRVRRRMTRALTAATRHLRRAFPHDGLVVIAQERLDDGRRAATWTIPGSADQMDRTILRLALCVDGRQLAVDEVLAALVDAYLDTIGATPRAAGLASLLAELRKFGHEAPRARANSRPSSAP